MTVPAIVTHVARAGYDDHLYFGHSTFAELLGAETCTGLNAMAVTGRRLDGASREMLDDVAVLMTVSDPRIWPLKLTRVVASYGATLPAFAVGQLALDGELLGPWTALYAAQLWEELDHAIGDDEGLGTARAEAEMSSLLARRKWLPGYGVPFRPRDERLDALRQRVELRGWQDRRFWRRQELFSRVVQRERGIGPNVGAGVSAVLLDLNLTVAEVPAMLTALMQNNFAAAAIEGARQAPAVLRSLPVDTAHYVGAPPRQSPRTK